MACQICSSSANLTRHHIVPKKAGGSNQPANLVTLCMSCHALVERYYWRVIAQTYPKLAYKYKVLSYGFINNEIPKQLIDLAKKRQEEIWEALLNKDYNWLDMYTQAKRWVQSVKPVKTVTVRDAILSDPWWVPNDQSQKK